MCGEAVKLLRQLVEDYGSFFDSSGYLNSEGRKALEAAVRSLMKDHGWVKKCVGRARKRATYENIVKLLEIVSEACGSIQAST
ncbi:MAG: hypothetical protein RMH84_01080 [Sulfolobales archaeon]|nr:hypothetical protein [Sulfolobales archaeon]MDW8010179.1 hypothetical protein [Sulfolobales archaeon]